MSDMACTVLSVDNRRPQQEVPVQLSPQSVECAASIQFSQRAFLGFRFDFVVAEDGQVVQLLKPVNS
jgi:hypothetical protein